MDIVKTSKRDTISNLKPGDVFEILESAETYMFIRRPTGCNGNAMNLSDGCLITITDEHKINKVEATLHVVGANNVAR